MNRMHISKRADLPKKPFTMELLNWARKPLEELIAVYRLVRCKNALVLADFHDVTLSEIFLNYQTISGAESDRCDAAPPDSAPGAGAINPVWLSVFPSPRTD